MLKARYFRVKLPCSLSSFGERAVRVQTERSSQTMRVVRRSDNEIILIYTIVRFLPTLQLLPDGTEQRGAVPTMEQHSMRFFRRGETIFLSIIDPPRGLKIVNEVLECLLENDSYFFEPLELSSSMIEKHVRSFSSSRLVSAKVRDFQVYEGAIGRLEITSQAGLRPEIAPFLADTFHRIDALTYAVTYKLTQGLVYYMRNGTVKVSGPLVDIAFPMFENSL